MFITQFSSIKRKSLVALVFKLGDFKLRTEVGQQIGRKKDSNPDRSFKVFLYWWMQPVLQIAVMSFAALVFCSYRLTD